MELLLRPPQPRFHPLLRRRGLRGLGDGTCQVPQPGVTQVYPPCPTSGYTGVPVSAAPAQYVAPTLIPSPACASGPAATADSQECQRQVMAAQQANFQLQNNANYAVDLANCLNTYPQPPDCYQRIFGLTPAGGFTSDARPQGVTTYQNAAGETVAPGPVYVGPSLIPSGGGAPAGTGARLSFTNLTTGDNSRFRVGDRWQLQITGAAPNSPVTVNGGMNGANALTQMGSTDSAGNFTLNGQMTQDQIGAWSEAWRVNNQIVQSFTFTVSPAGTTGGGQTVTTPTTRSVFGTLPGGSVSIGGTSVPVLALGAGVVVLFLLMRGK